MLPGGDATTNTANLQKAINYAAPLGQILSCQGNYPINGPINVVNGMKIFGRGEGTSASSLTGCVIHQTNSSSAIFVFIPGQIASFQLQDLQITGGRYGMYMVGTGVSSPNTAAFSDSKLIRTHWNMATGGTVLYMNNFAFIQAMYTEYNWFQGGGAGTSCWQELGSSSLSNGYIVGWESHHDRWGGCDIGLDIDDPMGGNAGGWDLTGMNFVGINQTPMVIRGNVRQINIYGGGAEQIDQSDPSPIVRSTCSTSGTNQTTLTCAASTYQNGQVLNVQGGATNVTYGGTTPGWDQSVTVTAGGGTTTLTVTPAIPLQVTNANTTNSQYDCLDFIKSPETNLAPDSVTIKNFGFAACSGHRYLRQRTFHANQYGEYGPRGTCLRPSI